MIHLAGGKHPFGDYTGMTLSIMQSHTVLK